MLRGDCGVSDIKNALATQFVRSPNETWSVQEFEAWLTEMSDQVTNSDNIELYNALDPFTWSSQGGIGYTLTTTQNNLIAQPGTISALPPDATENIYQTIRGFMVNLVATHPDWYGGDSVSGPYEHFNPTRLY